MVDLQGADELDINSVFNLRSSSFPGEEPKDRFRLMSGNKMNMDRIYQKIF
jgi:hypothetical protein